MTRHRWVLVSARCQFIRALRSFVVAARIDKEDEQLAAHEQALSATETFYLHPKPLAPSGPSSLGVPLGHLNVATACEVVFKETANEWKTLSELEFELNRRGKSTIKPTLELAMKHKPERFEWEKRGKKNFYRLKPASIKVMELKQTEAG